MSLRGKLLRRSVKSISGRDYFPESWLLETLSKPEIQHAVETCVVDATKRKEAVNVILNGGRRVFAILVIIREESMLVDFMETDNLLQNTLDSRLPLDFSTIRQLLPENPESDVVAKEFCDRQWEVLAPIFGPDLSHRVFDNMAIMPFLWGSSKKAGEGGFGFVDRVTLHEAHHGFGPRGQNSATIVRKQIKQSSNEPITQNARLRRPSPEFRNEERILSLLRSLKHPNIIQLLASYTHNDQHFLLFPMADCSLAEAFENLRLSQFSAEGLLQALCGLSSAIEHVHHYFSREYNLEMIGCHHDLKPKNILILRDKLLLADFGLSRLEVGENSSSIFKMGDRHYLAPECETFREDLTVRKNMIGRASDIWSFGATLAEITTYMALGLEGVTTFRTQRTKILHGVYTVNQFHHGGARCAAVHAWLDALEEEHNNARKILLNLIREALSIDSSKRPTASCATTQLYFAAQVLIFSSCWHMFERDPFTIPALELRIECERFRLWGQAAGYHSCQIPTWVQDMPQQHLESISNLLVDIRAELHCLTVALESPVLSPIYTSLRSYIDRLWSLAPENLWHEVRAYFVERVLSSDQSSEEALDMSIADHATVYAAYKDIGILAAMKYLLHRMNVSGSQEDAAASFNLTTAIVRNHRDFGLHRLGTLRGNPQTSTEETNILVEKIEYNASWVKDGHGDELLERVGAVVRLIRNFRSISRVQVLQCLGFFHEPESFSIGLVYRLPDLSPLRQDSSPQRNPISLRDFMTAMLQRRNTRPFLGTIFQLAHALASCILEYHTIEWFHKNISTYNIVFFPEDSSNESLLSAFNSLYLIGFNHARQSNESAFTQGPPSAPEHRQYLHPQYLSHQGHRFRWQYDYYSIGVVLLELGLWRFISDWTLSDKWRKLALSPETTRQKILHEVVPILGTRMGKTYLGAVEACLDDEFFKGGDSLESAASLFQKLVADPISTLLAV